MKPVQQEPSPTPLQLSLAFDPVRLRGLSPTERRTAIDLLASLLLEAGGVAARENDNDLS
jgi:hypothetical protein